MKQLIRVPLNELRTSDEEVLGSTLRRDGKVYRWQKNAGTTTLIADASCLEVLTSIEAGTKCRVVAPDGAAPSTGTSRIDLPAGAPVTAIGPSGSATGDHGWVQCRGSKRVTVAQAATAAQQVAGCLAIATSGLPVTQPWGRALSPTVGPSTTANMYHRQIVITKDLATTGVATAASAMVDIQCM